MTHSFASFLIIIIHILILILHFTCALARIHSPLQVMFSQWNLQLSSIIIHRSDADLIQPRTLKQQHSTHPSLHTRHHTHTFPISIRLLLCFFLLFLSSHLSYLSCTSSFMIVRTLFRFSPLIFVSASTFDRPYSDTPRLSYAQLIQIEIDGRTFFSDSIQRAYETKNSNSASNNTANSSSSSSTRMDDYMHDLYSTSAHCICQWKDNSAPLANLTSVVLALSSPSASNPTIQPLMALPYPLSSSRSGRQTWVELPQIGRQPAPRDAFTFVHMNRKNYISAQMKRQTQSDSSSSTSSSTSASSSSDLLGYAFLFGGSTTQSHSYQLSSLWALNLETTEWIPLGPSSWLSQTKSCIDESIPFDEGTYDHTETREGTVDQCFYSTRNQTQTDSGRNSSNSSSSGNSSNSSSVSSMSMSSQTDEFGCLWPSPRHAHSSFIIDDYLYLYGGIVQQQITTGIYHTRMITHTHLHFTHTAFLHTYFILNILSL